MPTSTNERLNAYTSGTLIQEQRINAILYCAITNIPWTKVSNVISKPQNDIKRLAEITLRKVSPSPSSIDFKEDIWDLSPYIQVPSLKSLVFNFQLTPEPHKEIVKLFVLYDITKTKNVCTSRANYSYLSSVLRALYLKGCASITSIDLAKVQEILISEHNSHNTNGYKGTILRRFLYFESAINDRDKNHLNLGDLDLFIKEERRLGIKARKLRKYPSIPEALVTIMQRKALAVMNSPNEPHNMRVAACCIIIQIWLGLRPIELVLLRKKDYYQENAYGKQMSYCLYRSPKNKMKSFPIYCFPLAAQAIETALQLARDNGGESVENLLFIIHNDKPSSLTSKSLSRLLDTFYVRYLLDEVKLPWDGLSSHKRNGQIIYSPSLYQFRVHLCTYLYDKGISRGWIEQNMSHLDSLSYGYYYRREDELRQKDREGVTSFIEHVVTDKTIPIGSVGPQILNDINTASINVKGDVDAIVKALGNKYRLRTLAFGICAKASVSRCQGETEYEKLLCAYGDCSKIIYTLDDFPEAYMRFNNLKRTYNSNLNSGRVNAATKELFIIKRMLSNRLYPEYIQLRKEIQECGIVNIMNKYPEIDKLKIDLNKLETEIALWKEKTN